MSQEKFLIVKSKAGLGNRILNLMDSILYARLSNRKLIVDWSDLIYSDDGSNVFPKLFTTPKIELTEQIPQTDSVYPLLWKGNLNRSINDVLRERNEDEPKIYRSPFQWTKYRIDTKRLNYPYECLVIWYYFAEINKIRRHFKGEYADLKRQSNEAILRTMLREELIPNQTIQDKVQLFVDNHFDDVTIGVHIRYTDRRNSYEGFATIVDQILSSNPGARIFLATDNQEIEQQFRDNYKNLTTTKKWFPDKVERLHENWSCPSRFENCVEALVDMYLLSRCNYLVCDQRSTLAYVASLLSKAPQENIFDMTQGSASRRFKSFTRWLDLL